MIRNSLRRIHKNPHRVRSALVATAAGLALAALHGCASRAAMPYEQGDSRYRFEFRLERMAGETGTCSAAVKVRDLAARRDLAIPLFTAPWGASTSRAAADSTYGARLTATVEVKADGASAAFRAELKRGDLLLAARTAAIPVKVVEPAKQRTYR